MSGYEAMKKRVAKFGKRVKRANKLLHRLEEERTSLRAEKEALEEVRWCEFAIAYKIKKSTGLIPAIALMAAEYASEHEEFDTELVVLTDGIIRPYVLEVPCWCHGLFEKPLLPFLCRGDRLSLKSFDPLFGHAKFCSPWNIGVSLSQTAGLKCGSTKIRPRKLRGLIRAIALLRRYHKMRPSREMIVELKHEFLGETAVLSEVPEDL